MYTFYFIDMETGEEFFVESENKNNAITVAKEFFARPKLHGTVSLEWAEMMGFDTY